MPIAAIIPIVVSILTGLAAIANYMLVQTVKLSVAEMRLEIANARSKDKEEMKAWINGSFMRSKEVEKDLDGMKHRIDEVERAVNA